MKPINSSMQCPQLNYILTQSGFILLAILFVTFLLTGCKEERSLYDNNTDINQYLTDNIILPAGSFRVSPDQVTPSNEIMITSSGSNITGGPVTLGANVVEGGESANISIDFSAVNADVTHAGIQFGDTSDIIMIPIDDAMGDTSGTLEFEALFPQELCDELSKICHDIRCYEYAVSQEINGMSYTISSSNINELVGFCGECDLPSCQQLIGPDCENPGGGGGGGLSNCIIDDWLPVETCELENGQLVYCEDVVYCDNTPLDKKIWSIKSNNIIDFYTAFCDGYDYDCAVLTKLAWTLDGSTFTFSHVDDMVVNCADGSPYPLDDYENVSEITCNGNELTLLIDGYFHIRFEKQ